MKFNKTILRKLRKEQGLTQKQLAEIIECSATDIARYEQGVVTPRPERIEKIAQALNIKSNQLCELDQTFAHVYPPETQEILLCLLPDEMDVIDIMHYMGDLVRRKIWLYAMCQVENADIIEKYKKEIENIEKIEPHLSDMLLTLDHQPVIRSALKKEILDKIDKRKSKAHSNIYSPDMQKTLLNLLPCEIDVIDIMHDMGDLVRRKIWLHAMSQVETEENKKTYNEKIKEVEAIESDSSNSQSSPLSYKFVEKKKVLEKIHKREQMLYEKLFGKDALVDNSQKDE